MALSRHHCCQDGTITNSVYHNLCHDAPDDSYRVNGSSTSRHCDDVASIRRQLTTFDVSTNSLFKSLVATESVDSEPASQLQGATNDADNHVYSDVIRAVIKERLSALAASGGDSSIQDSTSRCQSGSHRHPQFTDAAAMLRADLTQTAARDKRRATSGGSIIETGARNVRNFTRHIIKSLRTPPRNAAPSTCAERDVQRQPLVEQRTVSAPADRNCSTSLWSSISQDEEELDFIATDLTHTSRKRR